MGDLISIETKVRVETQNTLERLIDDMERNLTKDVQAETNQREET